MTKTKKNDSELFGQIKEHASDLKAMYAERDEDFEEYENAYLMDWQEAGNARWNEMGARVTTSPDARNAVLGAVRLLVATDPVLSIETEQEGFDKDAFENSLRRWWVQSGRVAGRPVHYDLLLSSILYGETHTAVTPTAELLERIKKVAKKDDKPDKKRIARVERLANTTPYLLESWNPKEGYPEMDRFGLNAYYRCVGSTVAKVRAEYGDALPEAFSKRSRYEIVTLHTFYDLDYCCIWIDDDLIYLDEHGWPEIPISCTLVDGSRLFTKPEDQRQPLLYSMVKAGLWEHECLLLTIIYTMVFGLGANPMFVHRAPPDAPDKRVEPNFDEPGGIIELVQGEEFAPMMQKGIIAPEVREALQLAESKSQQSTIYPQAFGAAIERNTTFSEMSLLSQTGRLPLIGPERMGGEAISKVLELALMLAKSDKLNYNKNGILLKASDLPKTMQIKAKLEVSLPQDKLQLSNIASILKRERLADDEWIQNNILNITDSKGTRRKIWTQTAAEAMFIKWMQEQLQPQMGQPGMAPGPQMPGAAMQGGLPQAQAGMVPGPGQGAMPPEGSMP